jgi:hypothetical protein
MNKIFSVAILSMTMAAFSACNNKQPDYDPSIATPLNQPRPDSSTGTAAPAVVNPVITDQTVTTPVTQTADATGMNPAHGQPGHRCDIAVGAPLNSAPTKPSTQNVSTAVTQPASTPTVKTAPGMNPPHGQPGHRCDIAVGASLSSPVTKPETQTITPSVSPINTSPAAETKNDATPSVNVTRDLQKDEKAIKELTPQPSPALVPTAVPVKKD